MGQALYRKYRSKSFGDIVGQDHITSTLRQAISQGRISHAYLFTGPRGVGKTSVARILAHEINGLPYTDDAAHLDIIEIDAASNRRIDEIRDLRDKVYVAPTSAKYKVYIIDEVHMLTREAFNALLKTLEEPPAHVIFVLATTDAHKLPATIVSRTQRFAFKPVDKTQAVEHLRFIAKNEKLQISDGALELLAEHGAGSLRDSISLLDQTANHQDRLEVNDVQQLLGIPPAEAVLDLLVSLPSADSAGLIGRLSDLYDQGFQASAIAKQLGELTRQQLIDRRPGLDREDSLSLLAELLEVPMAFEPERYLEIVLLRHMPAPPAKTTAKHDTNSTPPSQRPANNAGKTRAVNGKSGGNQPASAQHKEAGNTLNQAVWQQVLAALKQKYNTLYGVIRIAEASFPDASTVELKFSFAFHQKRVNEVKNRQIISATIQEITGHKVKVKCLLSAKAVPKTAAGTADMSTISNIFGGGELLES